MAEPKALGPLLTLTSDEYREIELRALLGDSVAALLDAIRDAIEELTAQRARVAALQAERDDALKSRRYAGCAQLVAEKDARIWELEAHQAAIYAKVRALPDPMARIISTESYCEWCREWMPLRTHPANGCLWHEAQPAGGGQ